tara:strand:- start:2796 stop:3398 length:603 start_codon:yes stop_codon:yes gene_type:complete
MKKRKLIYPALDPIKLFSKWLKEAEHKEINDPNAMNLATISKGLTPSSRMVLLKFFDESGFVFFTNIESKKGKSILFNQNVALTFHWKSLLRQVRIEGKAKIVSKIEADNYFNSRPIGSKISAWASNQSRHLKDRKEIIKNVNKYEKKFKNNFIPRPSYWSGYRVKPLLIEFWQDMPFRLHDRLEYKRRGHSWKINRLNP